MLGKLFKLSGYYNKAYTLYADYDKRNDDTARSFCIPNNSIILLLKIEKTYSESIIKLDNFLYVFLYKKQIYATVCCEYIKELDDL